MATLHENAISSLTKFLSWFNVNYTNATLKHLKLHPNYPSINALQDILHEMNINNLVVRLSVDELKNIPMPALAHFNREGGSFVVLKGAHNEQVIYYDSEYGMVTEAQQAFAEKWSGVLLLAEKNAKSGEPNYKQNKKQQLFETYSKYALALLSGCILATVFYFASAIELLHSVLALSGLAISIALIQKQFGASSAWVDSFCKLGSKTNCDEVLNTSYAKLFGIIHLSEVCTWYFSGIILSLLMGVISATQVLPILFIISCLTLPIVILSLYFQAFLIRKWCPLCVAVVAVLMLELSSHVFFTQAFNLEIKAIFLVSVSFTALLIPWLLLRQSSLLSLKVNGLQKKLYQFTKSHEVFHYLLHTKPVIATTQLPFAIKTYSHQNLIEIVLVTNPTCQPCARAHAIFEKLAEQFDNKINLEHRFSVNPETKHLLANKMLQHLLAVLISVSSDEAEKALSDWFKSGQYDFEQWKIKFPSKETTSEIEINSLLAAHYQWCQIAGVTKTPTIFINSRKLPEQYSVSDVSYQIRKMLEKISEPAQVS